MNLISEEVLRVFFFFSRSEFGGGWDLCENYYILSVFNLLIFFFFMILITQEGVFRILFVRKIRLHFRSGSSFFILFFSCHRFQRNCLFGFLILTCLSPFG